MENQQIVPNRRYHAAAQDRKHANGIAAPFVTTLKRWNVKATYLAARAASGYSSPEEKALARLEGGALLVEVQRRHTEYHAAIKGEPPHSRLDDVEAAFERLLERLRTLSAAP